MILLAVDPGLRGCGCSVWDAGRLTLGCYAVNPERLIRGDKAWRGMASAVREVYPLGLDALIIEAPQYDGRTRLATPDVFEVEGVVRKVFEAFTGGKRSICLSSVTPKEWKGNLPKTVTTNRVKRALSEEELGRIEFPRQASLAHNVWDGVALGLWHVQRTGQRV